MTTRPESSRRQPGRPVKPWVRRRRMLLLGAALTVALAFALLFSMKHLADRNHAARLEAVRAGGAPVTVAELPAWQANTIAVSAGQTPADGAHADDTVARYLRIVELLSGDDRVPNADLGDLLAERIEEGAFSPETLQLLREYLAAYGNVLDLLHETAGMPAAIFPLDYSEGYAMALPHLAVFRSSLRLLRAEAIVAAVDGTPARAFDALTAATGILAPLRMEPVLISQLVRVACQSILLDAFNDTLAFTTFDAEQLKALQRLFEDLRHPEAFASALMTERVFALQAFQQDPETLTAMQTGQAHGEGAFTPLRIMANAYGWFSGDRERFMDYMEKMIDAASLPYLEAKPVYDDIVAQLEQSTLLPNLSQVLLPAFGRLPLSMAANEARQLQGTAAAAIERYRLDHGTPPEHLEALLPDYLPQLPKDPFDGQPLRYQREGSGYVLYSISHNETDNGGKAGASLFEGDIVFRVPETRQPDANGA